MNPVFRRVMTALSVAALVVAAIVYAPSACFAPVVAVLAILAVAEYSQLLAKRISIGSAAGMAALFFGALFIVAALGVLPYIASRYSNGNLMLLYVVAIVKFSDMGGFAVGLTAARMMPNGTHKLCPGISPNKSWEGLFGSLLASVLMSLAFMPITGFGCAKSCALGAVAALVGTAGDLLESKFKRWVGVKDSSTLKITAGLGGILDMFDSLLLAPAVILMLI